jgi:hypothetical protein
MVTIQVEPTMPFTPISLPDKTPYAIILGNVKEEKREKRIHT